MLRTPNEKTLLLRYPNGSILQGYGENPDLYRQLPQPPGAPLLTGGHPGIDLYHGYGLPLRTPTENDCWVADVKYSPEGYGEHIRFIVDNQDEGGFLEVTYGHCSKIYAKIGDILNSKSVPALEGNSGVVFCGDNQYWGLSDPHKCGTHVHYGVRRLVEYNPLFHPNYITWLKRKFFVLDYNNGCHGFIDPRKYLDFVLPKPIIIQGPVVVQKATIIAKLVELFYKLISALKKLQN